MTKDDFIYALKTCEYTVHNGQVMYAEEDLIKRFDVLLPVTQKSGKPLPEPYKVEPQESEANK